jgi:hypothetical protein
MSTPAVPAEPDATGYVPLNNEEGRIYQFPAFRIVPVGLWLYVLLTSKEKVPTGDPVQLMSYDKPGNRFILVAGPVILDPILTALIMGTFKLGAIYGLSDTLPSL